jgi:hypothetical protein
MDKGETISGPIPSDLDMPMLDEHELYAVTGGVATMTAIAMAESDGDTSASTSPTIRTTPLWCCRLLGRW